uniref:(northern house mosquito) hypothetical protein n=1 Tax=Culex pipiens TaxID=7175 RepID=A0A8D8JRG3_CULPI
MPVCRLRAAGVPEASLQPDGPPGLQRDARSEALSRLTPHHVQRVLPSAQVRARLLQHPGHWRRKLSQRDSPVDAAAVLRELQRGNVRPADHRVRAGRELQV